MTEPSDAFLRATPEIDLSTPSIQSFLAESGWNELSDLDRTQAAYLFVRDKVRHSWDAQDTVVTCDAPDVLREGTGICYAKSHLLAALLRGMGIPAGICYQRLVLFDDPADGYCLHALNAAYVPSLSRWLRFDARGNRDGIDAQFSLDAERLAFAIRPELGEVDDPTIYSKPLPSVVSALRSAENVLELYRNGLPSELS